MKDIQTKNIFFILHNVCHRHGNGNQWSLIPWALHRLNYAVVMVMVLCGVDEWEVRGDQRESWYTALA